MNTILGFDFGPAKIGIAVGQTLTCTATPLETLRAVQDKPNWEGISRLVETWKPDALVVGLPYNMDDTEAMLTEDDVRTRLSSSIN